MVGEIIFRIARPLLVALLIKLTYIYIYLLLFLCRNSLFFIRISQQFEEGQGIRQGGANSSHVFKGKANPFLKLMEESGIGNHVGSIYMGTPTCADDVALLANRAVLISHFLAIRLIDNFLSMSMFSI